MKNTQAIDGALNCTFSIFAAWRSASPAADEEFG